MLELGGALEYKSHPEINEGWQEYAAFMNEYPGKTIVMQNCFGWEKNSIHSENGGGKIVPQEMFLKLVNYCRERFMDVIPEMPSLSHSDYLLTRHRELAERP
jgi:hexosaminidase